MSTKYKATDTDKAYFITITTVEWVDVFTRLSQRKAIIEALKYCQANKGLEIYAFVVMPSHIHMMCRTINGHKLSDTIRVLKSLPRSRGFVA